jgi:hypothetical protein
MHCSSRNYDRLAIDQMRVKARWGNPDRHTHWADWSRWLNSMG